MSKEEKEIVVGCRVLWYREVLATVVCIDPPGYERGKFSSPVIAIERDDGKRGGGPGGSYLVHMRDVEYIGPPPPPPLPPKSNRFEAVFEEIEY